MIQSIENGRKEDGNRSIADKILKRLHDLDKTIENNKGRWAWELLQNAKDSIAEDDGAVDVEIVLDSEKVEFRHNGTHFSEQDIRGLINQISSKELEDGVQTKKVGRFGTGFLTTHLLSRVVDIKGIVLTATDEFYHFQFPLDREAKSTIQLIPKIELAWKSFHDSAYKIDSSYNDKLLYTSFSYSLSSDAQKSVARVGIEEFEQLLPYVLAFVPKISSVAIIDNTCGSTLLYRLLRDESQNSIKTIQVGSNGTTSNIHLLCFSNSVVSIAAELEENTNGYSVKPNQNLPKLFCDFPLIGTEDFTFPVLVSSFFFNPQTERDGIWLKGNDDIEVIENRKILTQAVELYSELLAFTDVNSISNLYNICDISIPTLSDKHFDDAWYKEAIQKPLRKLVFNSNLVESELAGNGKQKLCDTWFPLKSYSKSVRDSLWEFNYDLFPSSVCKRAHLHEWCELSWEEWNKLTYTELLKDVTDSKPTIDALSEVLVLNYQSTIIWLNKLYKFIASDEANLTLFEKYAFIPNKNNFFKKKGSLFIDNINDPALIDITKQLGEDWNEILLHNQVTYGEYYPKIKKDISLRITEILKAPSSSKDFTSAITSLSQWFDSHGEEGKDYFPELYRKRAELFLNTIQDKDSLYIVMRSKTNLADLSRLTQDLDNNPRLLENIKNSDGLSELLSDYNAKDINELRQKLFDTSNRHIPVSKVEITPELLISLGITNVSDLVEALKDKDFAAQFNHTSTPNVATFVFVQGLIERAKRNVIAHLQSLDKYDCSDVEELAPTVLGGVRKEGVPIHIVVRPSDNGQVIIYYSSEKDILDYEASELWIENGKDLPRNLTLGGILKATGINKIPV